MLRKSIALIFLSIFMSSVVMPTVLSLIDKDIDITFLIDLNEEESKEKESTKDLEVKILEIRNSSLAFHGLETNNAIDYYLRRYAKPHLNLASPPPELHIL